ncbi:MAG: hypothetical protein KAH54_03765 [Candidatus Sabulitectum sp.]|nr:hypothetical protein [Candidatus Sabulitectum sp.]
MRSFTVISGLVLLVLSAACTSNVDDITSPAVPGLMEKGNGFDSTTDECRANMTYIASQAVIFFACNGRYPDDLEEMGMAGVVCPACMEEYDIIGIDDYFYIECPLPFSPDHGNIDDGVASWLE